jgi:hypothetical protein
MRDFHATVLHLLRPWSRCTREIGVRLALGATRGSASASSCVGQEGDEGTR